MKSAREMFEELGYTRENGNDVIIYRYHLSDDIREVVFDLSIKEYLSIHPLGGLFIDVKMHKAIHKQLEEMGWLDE